MGSESNGGESGEQQQPKPPVRKWPYIVSYEVRGERVRESFDLGHQVRVGEIVPLAGGRRIRIDEITSHPEWGGIDGEVTGRLSRWSFLRRS